LFASAFSLNEDKKLELSRLFDEEHANITGKYSKLPNNTKKEIVGDSGREENGCDTVVNHMSDVANQENRTAYAK
jgi:hypothetical protein